MRKGGKAASGHASGGADQHSERFLEHASAPLPGAGVQVEPVRVSAVGKASRQMVQ